jgi:predicted Fe-Mo cluster-binding NifX family protein
MYDVVILGVPVWQGRISPLLDTATRLLVLACRDGKEISRREVVLEALEPEAFADKVAELQVDLLLCAALSEDMQRALRQQAIRVHPHVCGEIGAVLCAFCHQRLGEEEFRMPGSGRSRFRGKRAGGRKSSSSPLARAR